MATAVPIIQGGSDGLDSITKLLAVLNPMLGSGTTRTSGGTTTSSEKASVDGETNDQTNALLQKIMGDANGPDIDNMVANILTQAKNAFGSQAIESNAAGVRGYSDTVQTQLRNDAMAKAVAASAQAKLGALNEANRTATQLVSNKMSNTRSIQQATTKPGTSSSTGASTLGQATQIISGAAAIRSLMSKKGAKIPGEDGPVQVGGPPEGEIDSQAMNDQAFNSPADGGIDVGQLTAGGDANQLLAQGRAESALLTPNVVDPELANPNDSDAVSPEHLPLEAANTSTDSISPAHAPNIPFGSTNATTDAVSPSHAGTSFDLSDGGDAVDVIPSDLSSSIDFTNLIGDAGADIAGDAAGEGAAEAAGLALDGTPIGPIFTLANIATEGELGKSILNLPVIGEPIGDFGSATYDTAGEIGGGIDAGKDAASTLVNAPGEFLDSFADEASDIAGGGCYITTAATRNGEIDNGFTLTALRNFRDEYMLQDPQRHADLLEYYATAPEVVRRINASSKAEDIWGQVRVDYLIPAVVAYVTGNNEAAYEIYFNMMKWVKNQGVN